jgi:DNA-binding NtrC family response regulator
LPEIGAEPEAQAGPLVRGSAAGTIAVVSADRGLRQRLASSLAALRWQVSEAQGGAEAMMRLGERGCEAMLLDTWLPDLEAAESADHVRHVLERAAIFAGECPEIAAADVRYRRKARA